MSKKLTEGCVVFMKASSGLTGYGNAQCVSSVCEPLGEVSLYGHNQNYKTYDIGRIVEYPNESLRLELTQLREAIEAYKNCDIKQKDDDCPNIRCWVQDCRDEYIDKIVKQEFELAALREPWIPVSERLPEDNDTVFVVVQYEKEVFSLMGRYSFLNDTRKWEVYPDTKLPHVTHWMPIPTLPDTGGK